MEKPEKLVPVLEYYKMHIFSGNETQEQFEKISKCKYEDYVLTKNNNTPGEENGTLG